MQLRKNSILAKIVVLQIGTLAVVTAALFLAGYMLLNSDAAEFERRSLQSHANNIARSLHVEADGSIRAMLSPKSREFYAKGLGGLAFAVTDRSGAALDMSRALDRIQLMGDPTAGAPVYFQSTDKQRSYLGISVPVKIGNRDVWVQVTRKVRHPAMVTADVAAFFLQRIGWYAIPIIGLVLVVSVLVMRRMLRPIVTISELAGSIDPNRLDTRLPTQDVPGEIVPLVKAVNTSLTTIERSFHLQRDFTAYAAHELRTPLSILRMQIEGLADKKVAESLRDDVDTMSHIVDQLLNAAEFEAMAVSPDEQVDLHKVCSDVIELMEPLALSDGKDLALIGEEGPVWLNGSAPMLFHAVRNLVENALKYSPSGTCVEVMIEPEGIVRVMDEGAGVPEAQRALVFQKFWRGDRTKTNGAGLGLAIVSRVAEAHGGCVKVNNRSGGGAVFIFDLTAARVATAQ
jgi:signal transduction histidine kinase